MSSVNRRDFVKAATAAGVGAGVAGRMSPLLAAQQPSNRVRVAVMGVNSRGNQLAKGFARQPGAEVAIVCDVDARAMTKTIEAVRGIQSAAPRGEKDVRRVLEDPSIDALVIAAPDHWHAPAAILALNAGKHVYVEKPAGHNPREGELLVEAAARRQRQVQLGTQRRSWPHVIEAIQAIHEGVIGRAYFAHTWYANNRPTIGRGGATAVPEWLDYDLWQGPAPHVPFKSNYVHYDWHWFWHWGTGESGNNGTHVLDVARWGLGVGLPEKVTASGGRYRWDDDWECPDTAMLTWEFPGKKMISWEGRSCAGYEVEGTGAGVIFHGDGGTLVVDGNGYRVFDLKQTLLKEVKDPKPSEDQGLVGPGERLDAVHIANFLGAVRGTGTLNAPITEGVKSTLLAHLGNIAWRAGRVLHTDPATGRVTNDAEATKLWGREYERGWGMTE